MTQASTVSTQLEIAQRLQMKWLEKMEKMLDDDSISATDMATLARLLTQNGWVLDSTRLPTRLKDKLTSEFDPTAVDTDDKVVPIRASRKA